MMLEVGDYFGSYKVLRLLGKGGMGSVFLLQDVQGRFAAAKILDPEAASDHESRARFLREAQIAQKVETPSVVRTFDVGEDPRTGLCYILMEYVGGGSLHDLLKLRTKLSVAEALDFTRRIAEVLEEVREYGIVHRDIKPDNIMFDSKGNVKLADLGIARSVSAKVTTITKSGVVMGTPAYMAPEQMLDSHSVDTRSDIYALGIVLYEMLVGVRPYHNATFMELMAKAVKGEKVPDVRTLDPALPKEVARLIAKMCHPKADKRFATPGEVVAAIEKLDQTPPRKAKSVNKSYMLGGSLAAALVVAAMGTALTIRSKEAEREEKKTISPTEFSPIALEKDYEEEISQELTETSSRKVLSLTGSDEPVLITKGGEKIYACSDHGLTWYYGINDKGEAALRNYDKEGHKIAAVSPNPTGTLIVPTELNGHKVVRIAGEAFKNVEASYIELPETLREVGSAVFNDCHNLKKIRFPDSVEKVDSFYLFRRCDSIEEIDLNRAKGFGYMSIFYAGAKLKKIKFDQRYSDLRNIGGAITSADGKVLIFMQPKDNDEPYRVPRGVEIIGGFAFAALSEKAVKIEFPETLKTCDQLALSGLKADTLTFPEGFKTLGPFSFWQAKVGTLVIPASQNHIHPNAFLNFSARCIVFEGEVPKEMNDALARFDKNATRVYVRKSAHSWQNFKDYPITMVEDADLKEVREGKEPGDRYLAYVAATGEKVYSAKIGKYTCFYVLNAEGDAVLHHPSKEDRNTRLTAIEPNPTGVFTLPSELNGHKLVRLERDSLHHLKASFINIPNTIRSMGMGVFSNCGDLQQIDFPSSVERVEAYWLFNGCHRLRELNLNRAQGYKGIAFGDYWGVGDLRCIHVSSENPELKEVDGFILSRDGKRLYWVNQTEKQKDCVALPEGVENVEMLAFRGCRDIKVIEFPKSLKNLDYGALNGCKLERIVFNSDMPEKFNDNALIKGSLNRPGQKMVISVPDRSTGWPQVINEYQVRKASELITKLDQYPFLFEYELRAQGEDIVQRSNKIFNRFRAIIGLSADSPIANLEKVVQIELVGASNKVNYSKKQKKFFIGELAKRESIDNGLVNLACLYPDAHEDEVYRLVIDYVGTSLHKEFVSIDTPPLNKEQRLLHILSEKDSRLLKNFFAAREKLYNEGRLNGKMSRHDFIAVLSMAINRNLFRFANSAGIKASKSSTKINIRSLKMYEFTREEFDKVVGRKAIW